MHLSGRDPEEAAIWLADICEWMAVLLAWCCWPSLQERGIPGVTTDVILPQQAAYSTPPSTSLLLVFGTPILAYQPRRLNCGSACHSDSQSKPNSNTTASMPSWTMSLLSNSQQTLSLHSNSQQTLSFYSDSQQTLSLSTVTHSKPSVSSDTQQTLSLHSDSQQTRGLFTVTHSKPWVSSDSQQTLSFYSDSQQTLSFHKLKSNPVSSQWLTKPWVSTVTHSKPESLHSDSQQTLSLSTVTHSKPCVSTVTTPTASVMFRNGSCMIMIYATKLA